MNALFKGALDMPFAFHYIVIRACKPKFGSQAPIKIIMESNLQKNFHTVKSYQSGIETPEDPQREQQF